MACSVISQRTLCYAAWQAAEGCVMDALLSSRKSYAAPVCTGGEKKKYGGKKTIEGFGREAKKKRSPAAAAAAAAAAKQRTVKC